MAQWLVRQTAERLGEGAVGSIPTVGVCQLTAIFQHLVAAARYTVPSPGARLVESCWGFKTVADASGTAAGATPS